MSSSALPKVGNSSRFNSCNNNSMLTKKKFVIWSFPPWAMYNFEGFWLMKYARWDRIGLINNKIMLRRSLFPSVHPEQSSATVAVKFIRWRGRDWEGARGMAKGGEKTRTPGKTRKARSTTRPRNNRTTIKSVGKTTRRGWVQHTFSQMKWVRNRSTVNEFPLYCHLP